jgi:hypothetical protein
MLAGTKSQVDPSEAELIQRALSGQEEAFRELVRPWKHSWLRKLFCRKKPLNSLRRRLSIEP